MGLVDYSDSDASDNEEAVAPKPAPTPPVSKTGFQKVVDRSNPGKIRVSLPQVSSASKDDEPPAKRAKLGGGSFGGFNSFLPAPKRTGVAGSAVALGGGNGVKRGLGAGINLKTGAAPGFSREAEPERDYEVVDEKEETSTSETGGTGLNLPTPKAATNSENPKPAEEVKLVGKPLMFKPLSVSRKPTKKKKLTVGSPLVSVQRPDSIESPGPNTPQKASRPKVSLFSLGAESATSTPVTKGDYQPILYDTSTPQEVDEDEDSSPSFHEATYEEYTPTTHHSAPPPFVPTPPVSQSLSEIAGDLNLSAAERRQLFGRQKGGKGGQAFSATNVINFNTDKEYLHNEELRAAGETVVHNPVRSIAPGKHSLKQLVNAAQSQKAALEESFNKGKSNRAEASSRYGW